MNPTKLIGIILIVAGSLGLAYGGFSYTKETHAANIGPLHLEVVEKERVNIPLWMGLAAAAAGLVLLVASGRKS
jgi:multidrug transporter EmrE-like cation transporter